MKPTSGVVVSPWGLYALISTFSSFSMALVVLAAAIPYLPTALASQIPFTQQGITALACVATSIAFLLYTSLPSSKAARRKPSKSSSSQAAKGGSSTPKAPSTAPQAAVSSAKKKPAVAADKRRSASRGRSASASASASKKQQSAVRRK